MCVVEKGSDPLFFQWSINGNNIKSSPDFHYKIDNFERFSTLTIEKLKRDDSANYGCVVSNRFGSDSQNVLLTVKGMKSILISLSCLIMFILFDSMIFSMRK